MQKLALAFVAAAALFGIGCKKKGADFTKQEDFATRMCACTDKTCADKLNDEYGKWGAEQTKSAAKNPTLEPDDAKKAAELTRKYTDCSAKHSAVAAEPVKKDEPKNPNKDEPTKDEPKNPKKDGGGADAAKALAMMEDMSKKMCECKDKACADKVADEMKKWADENKGKADPNAKPDPKMTEVAMKYGKCMTDVMTPAAGKKDAPKADPKKPEPKKPDDKKGGGW